MFFEAFAVNGPTEKKIALILLFKGPKNKKENYCDDNIEQNVEIPYKYQG